MTDPIAAAIPAFILLMVAEAGVALAAGNGGERPFWRSSTAVSALSCGILSQLTGLILGHGVHAAVWSAVAARSPWSWGTGPISWIAAFFAVDFTYYWWHRASHRVALLWAGHSVHHQSEDYNLAVALRQPILDPITTVPFYLPWALLGMPPEVYFTTLALNTVGQFWFHTRLIDRLGWLEAWLNTPSHHRVHHGIEPAYVDRNHGGILIVWDRMFGTFTAERHEPTYGVVPGFPHASPWEANWRPLHDRIAQARQRHGYDRWMTLFGPPEWTPDGPTPVPEPASPVRWRPHATGRQHVGAWAALAVAAVALIMFLEPSLPTMYRLGAGLIAAAGVTVAAGRVDPAHR